MGDLGSPLFAEPRVMRSQPCADLGGTVGGERDSGRERAFEAPKAHVGVLCGWTRVSGGNMVRHSVRVSIV